jgi:hypothetical protein
MADERVAMTAFAQAAMNMSVLINTKFADTRFSGKLTRQPKVEAPHTESTGGGKQARESIVLRSESGSPKETITCGFLDVGLRACELRSFSLLKQLNKERHNAELDLNQSEYDKFLGELEEILAGQGFVVKILQAEGSGAGVAAPKAAQTGGGNTGVMIAVGALVALIVVGIIAVFAMK